MISTTPPGFQRNTRNKQVEFSVSTYNALLDVCARSGNISRAEPLLKDMADQGAATTPIARRR